MTASTCDIELHLPINYKTIELAIKISLESHDGFRIT